MPGSSRLRSATALMIASMMLLASCDLWGPKKGFERPNGVALASDGTLYVMDFGNYRIVHVDQKGNLLESFGQFGPKEDQVFYGWDLAMDSQGNLYFGNVIRDNEGTRHDGVKVFSSQGKFIKEIGAADYDTESQSSPHQPYGVNVDQAGHIYTADYGTKGVRIFSPEGKLLATINGSGQEDFKFTNPGDVATDDRRGLMYITDFTMGNLLQFELTWENDLSPRIRYLRMLATYGREDGQLAFPQNLAVDVETGTVFVGDMANRRVQAFSPEGEFLGKYSPTGIDDWQVLGVAAGQNGQLVACDALNNMLWVFSAQQGSAPIQQIGGKP